MDEKSELYKDAPRTYKKRKFNAFFDNGKSQQQGDKKKPNNKKKDQPKFNNRLMTFEGAKDLDADAIKVSLVDACVCVFVSISHADHGCVCAYRKLLARTMLHPLPFLEKVLVTLN